MRATSALVKGSPALEFLTTSNRCSSRAATPYDTSACPMDRSLLKTLSENRQVEQHVGAGLNQGQPVVRLLGPASAEAAMLGQPADRPLHHPSSRQMRLPMRGLLLL